MSTIGVILPVYNGEKYIKESVISILDQSYKDFKLYVIDDGSTDNTINVLSQFKDERLNVIKNTNNKGLIYTLNLGLELCSEHEYIARMDADDISLPNRFSIQYDFMKRNHEIKVLGTAMLQFSDETNESKKIFRPQTSDKIASTFMFYNPISHPTVMIRCKGLKQRFSYDFPKYEDYHFWISLYNDSGFYNMNDVLLKYRRHDNNVTSTYFNESVKDHSYGQSLIKLFSNNLNVDLSDEQIKIISIISNKVRYNIEDVIDLNYLYNQETLILSKLTKRFNKEYFKYLFEERMFLYYINKKRYYDSMKVFRNMNFKNKERIVRSALQREKR